MFASFVLGVIFGVAGLAMLQECLRCRREMRRIDQQALFEMRRHWVERN